MYMCDMYDAHVCVYVCKDVRTYPWKNNRNNGESGMAKKKKHVFITDAIHKEHFDPALQLFTKK